MLQAGREVTSPGSPQLPEAEELGGVVGVEGCEGVVDVEGGVTAGEERKAQERPFSHPQSRPLWSVTTLLLEGAPVHDGAFSQVTGTGVVEVGATGGAVVAGVDWVLKAHERSFSQPQ